MSYPHQDIIRASTSVDEKYKKLAKSIVNFQVTFSVPKNHQRHNELTSYTYTLSSLEEAIVSDRQVVLADASFQNSWVEVALTGKRVIWVDVNETQTKEQTWLNEFIREHDFLVNAPSEIVIVGGGILTNAGGYIAEKLECDLIYVPTTVLSMADGSIGGKVRANFIDSTDSYHKHQYKSFYEPNRIILDTRFLDSLPDSQISIGIAEILKHGVFQSEALLKYLASDEFNPFQNKRALLKAILWTVELKAVCLQIDPDESSEGSYVILRGAHDVSDKIEERSRFTIPHGTAVALALYDEVSKNKQELLPVLNRCYQKLHIPTTTESLVDL